MKLALDAGHGINTAGKRCLKSIDPNETREWVLNNRICNYIQANLSKYDVQILRLDDITGKTDVSLSYRTVKANTWGADFTLSIHHNAGAKGITAGGITIHIHPFADSTIADYQKRLYDTLIRHTGLKGNRASPLSRDNFQMLRSITRYRSILIEHGFMDSKTDTPIILTDRFARQCADAHAEFIVSTFNLKEVKPMAKSHIEDWQKFLNSKGGKLVVDGDFGQKSLDAGVALVKARDVEIAALKKSIDGQKKTIAELNAKLSTANTSVITLTANYNTVLAKNKAAQKALV